MDAVDQARLVRDGEATPLELVDAAIARIEATNPEINAVIFPTFEKARDAARGSIPDGPFRGVPFLVKDLGMTTAGDPYCQGSNFLKEAGWVAPTDSHLATKLRAAGFILCGRTNTPEWGTLPTTEPLAFGATRNPWDVEHSAGGSSGGSSAAVAAGMVPVAQGGDGGGSLRVPASACGIVGLKPSRGRVSPGPDIGDPLFGLNIQGVMSRTVRDTAAVMDCISGPMPGDARAVSALDRPLAEEVGANPGALRIGCYFDGSAFDVTTHPDCVAATQDAAELLGSLGHKVEEAHPAAMEEAEVRQRAVAMWSVAAAMHLDHWSPALGRTVEVEEVEPHNQILVNLGRSLSATDFHAAREWLYAWTRRMQTWWEEDGWDLLLTPTMAQPPPRLGELTSTDDDPGRGMRGAIDIVPFTQPFNITGQPGISLPLHWNEGGLPIGVQLVAGFGREDLLIRVAAQLEAARPWANRRPPVFA
ncbi:MAG: amidase [Deltaproteobacteria bacterium]|nr:amidase [Deltaproteobacteria bacterium]